MQCADKTINTRMTKTSGPPAGDNIPELQLFKNDFTMSVAKAVISCLSRRCYVQHYSRFLSGLQQQC